LVHRFFKMREEEIEEERDEGEKRCNETSRQIEDMR
jgi:hypothetical protein